MPAVGASSRRKEGPEKVCGVTKYVDDDFPPGCLHGATLRSAIPHGTIRAIRFDPSFPWEEYVIARAEDIPGENAVTLIEKDQPLLADSKVEHREEPILLVAHPLRHRAYEALAHIAVDYEELEPVFEMERSPRVFKEFRIEKGDLEAGRREADVIVEGEYRVPHQEQAYIETNGVAAWEEEDGTLVVMGSLQCPYYVHKALGPIFRRPPEKIRVIQTPTGGGFGGKEEYPNLIAGHAALLALKAGRVVKIVYDRHEDMRATTKRHPARVRHRTGVRRDGTLAFQDVEVLMDGGAYVTLSPVVLSRGLLHATGPYECPHVRVVGRVVATHTPPNGAFRGFGAPQTLFAAELHIEKIASVIGMDALTLRRKNLFREGSVTATGQVLSESVGLRRALDRCLARSGYERKRKELDRWNRRKANPTWRGIGLATVFHGSGFTGSGEVMLASRARVSLTPEGEIRIETASTEIGQGTTSMFCQIVADTLGLPYAWIRAATPDTSRVPNSGPTVASRTCMVVGGLLRRSALALERAVTDRMGKFPRRRAGLRRAAKALCGGGHPFGFEVQYENPPEIHWDDATYRGDAYAVYSYAAAAVELEVDKLTYAVRVRRVTTAQDVGKAINPLLVEGQITGGTVQALGYALLENAIYAGGVMQNAQLTNYIIPTTLDTPPMTVEIVESPYSRGPFGAKGVGELPMDVPAPAVAAALHHATGRFFTELPLTPERIQRTLSGG